eukprot:COSAG02_NODE_2940_length_7697_cov_4.700316_5_plen_64_part_00
MKTVESQQEELVALRQHSSAASGADKAAGIEIADMQAKLKAEQVRSATSSLFPGSITVTRTCD